MTRGKIVELSKTIRRVAKAVVVTESPELEQELRALQLERKQLESQYEKEKLAAIARTDSGQDYAEIISTLNEGLRDNEFRVSLRSFIRRTISDIVVKPDGYRVNFKNHNEHITITPNEYKKACDAHKDGKAIRIFGVPEKAGKFWTLTKSHDFVVL